MRIILSLFFFNFFIGLSAQDVYTESGWLDYWLKQDSEFRDPEGSPLSEGDRADFDSIPRYLFNPDFVVQAKWVEIKRAKPQKFKSTGEVRDMYQKAGSLSFVVGEDSLELFVFRNLALMRNPAFADYLFIPFTDLTNGESTYAGGRYLDFSMPDSAEVTIDFNRAYNPYCVYSSKYSCPIPPAENHLKVEIRAGAKLED